jgi:hypothetical protein
MIAKRSVLFRAAIATVVALAAFAVLWWSLWAISAAQFRSFIDDWIAAHSAAGYQVHYDARTTSGFPQHIALHLSNFVLQNSDGIRIHSDDLDLSTLPWRWHHLKARSNHGFDLVIPFSDNTSLNVTGTGADGYIDLDASGNWKSLKLQVVDAKALWAQTPFFSGDMLEIALTLPSEQPKNTADTGLTIKGAADNLILPTDIMTPFGPKVGRVDISLRVMGSVPDPRHKDAVAAWSNAGGLLAIDKLYLDWGPLLFQTEGTLGLDDDMQPEGVFASQIGHHKEVLDALMNHNYIPKRQAGMLDSALNLFTKPTSIDGKSGIAAPITVQLGGLFFGPVRMFEFPEIAWDEDADTAEDAHSSATPAKTPAVTEPAQTSAIGGDSSTPATPTQAVPESAPAATSNTAPNIVPSVPVPTDTSPAPASTAP